jgi:hypothetical protein
MCSTSMDLLITVRHLAAGLGSEEVIERITRHPSSSLRYMGSKGLAKVAGLHIAFLSGAPHSDDAKELINDINQCESGDIDLLLTSEWPAGVTRLSECAPGGKPHLATNHDTRSIS